MRVYHLDYINPICGKWNVIMASDYISVMKESDGFSFGGP